MGNSAKYLLTAVGAVTLLASSLSLVPTSANAADEAKAAEGKKIAENRKKGNCFACHDYPGAVLPGNIGPKLINMKARYPDREKLKAQIWDATKNNPNTIMPPFGRHRILTEEEIDKVVEFMYTL